jgi:hypothetical protein
VIVETIIIGPPSSREGKQKSFSGVQAKKKFYEKRKTLKQQKKFGLTVAPKTKTSSKANKKNNKRTSLKQKKRDR